MEMAFIKCIAFERNTINPFLPNVSILYPLKTPEKQRHKMGTLARMG